MTAKKNYRVDDTYIISTDAGDNPKLGARVLKDGVKESLFLDYYLGYTLTTSKSGKTITKPQRKRERLSLYLWHNPRSAMERQQNKDTMAVARKIRYERGQELLESAEGYRLKHQKKVDLLAYFGAYVEDYNKGDKRNMQLAYNRFLSFLADTPKYAKFQEHLNADQLTKDMVADFTDYLQERSVGEGAHSIYARFKKFVKYAVEHDVIMKNPCTGVVIKIDSQQLKKEVLSLEEIQALITTHYEGENTEIRRAFILCLYCGLRWCDVQDLTFANVDYTNKRLSFEQNKTKGHSGASGVVIPLNDALLRIIGPQPQQGERRRLIFNLPSYTTCLHHLKRWVAEAGINKHISWHCARHSFAVNILNNGANVKTLASLLGHSGLKHTEKYTRAVDKLKEDAINSLPLTDIGW